MTSLAPQPGVVLVRRAGGQPVCRGRRQLKVSKPAPGELPRARGPDAPLPAHGLSAASPYVADSVRTCEGAFPRKREAHLPWSWPRQRQVQT